MIITYITAFFVTLPLSLFLTPVVRGMALKYNFVAKPKKDRWSKRLIPICGGIAIFLSFALSLILFGRANPLFIPLLGGSIAIFICGLIDDIFSIKPYSKLFIQIVIASFMYLGGIGFKIMPLSFLNFFLTVFWFVAIMNAFNLLDNMDGLCAGITAVSAGIIFAYYGFYTDYNVAIVALIIGAAALGFLRYNFYPAKIFMGDCGSMLIGFIMAAISVMGTSKGTSNFLITLIIPVLVLGVPVFDTIFVTFTRRINGRHFYEGGKDHTSHRLVVLGMSERRAVLTLYFISLCCGLVAFMYTKLGVATGFVIMMAVLLMLVFFGIFLNQVKIYTKDKDLKDIDGKEQIYLGGMIYHKQRMFEMMADFMIISIAYIAAYLLRYEGVLSGENLKLVVSSLPILLIIKLTAFYWFGLYKGVWEYVGLHDIFGIFKAVTAGSLVSFAALGLMFRLEGYSRAVFIIDWLLLLFLASAVRIAMRLFKEYFNLISGGTKKVLIIGAGDAGEYLLRGLRYNKNLNYLPIGFIDDDKDKKDMKIHGVPILGVISDIPRLLKKYDINEVIVAIPSMNETSYAKIDQVCRASGIVCRKMSDLLLWQ